MSNVFYRPAKGSGYGPGSSFGFSFLVLGESMYEEDPNSLTLNIVKDVLIPNACNPEGKRIRFYTNVFQLVTGKRRPHALHDVKQFWDNISFYNYIQCPVGRNPGDRPTKEMFTNSAPAFKEVAAELLPEAILVCGKTLWDNLHRLDLIDTGSDGFGRLKIEPQTCKLAYVYHPSRRFAWRWHGAVKSLLDATRRKEVYP